jgi:integrase
MAEKLLTEKHLQAAKPDPERDLYLADGGGLYARVLAGYTARNKRIAFQYRYKIHGRTRYYHCGTYAHTSLAEARRMRDAARRLREKGIDPVGEQKRLEAEKRAKEQADALEKTVRGLFEDWERRYLKHKRKDGGALARQFLESDVLDYIGSIRARDVTRAQIVEVIDRIADRGAKRKANAVLSLLRQMFGWGLARGVVEVDPTHGLKREHAGGKESARERNLSAEEIADLARRLPNASVPDRVQAALWLLLATGARVGELVKAHWSEFDLKAGIWTIPAERSKNGKPHAVHLSGFALDWLKRLREKSPGALLFEGRKDREPLSEKWIGKCIRDRQRAKALRGRTKKTGVLLLDGGEWRIHDLRRTMASRMGDLGIAPYVIEKCLNHALDGILRVYQHQEYLPERKAAFERWGAELARLSAGEAARPNVLPLRGKRGR